MKNANVICSATDTNGRDNNEDCCMVFELFPFNTSDKREKITVLLIADGMGGYDHGEIVSNTVVIEMASIITKSVLEYFITPALNDKLPSLKSINFEELILTAIVLCNSKIRKLIQSNKWKIAGATLVAVLIIDNSYYWGYLGDSRLYHWHFNEQALEQITNDHSLINTLLKEEVITPEVAKYHPQKHHILYYMGIEELPPLEKVKFVGKGSLVKNDVLFLCTDGICGKISNTEFSTQFKDFMALEDGSNGLMENFFAIAKKLGETDNQTQILFKANEVCPKVTGDLEGAPDSTDEVPPDSTDEVPPDSTDEVPPDSTDESTIDENPTPQNDGGGATIINPTNRSNGCMAKILQLFIKPIT